MADELYARATRLNAKLASKYDSALASEGRQVAEAILGQLQGQIPDFQDFVRKVERSEEFPLHESAQLEKNEQPWKVLYLRAADLLQTIKEAEARRKS